MATLTGSPQTVSLGEGYAVRAPGVRGAAQLQRPRSGTDRARGRTEEDGTEALDRALAATDVTEVRQIDLRVEPTIGAAGAPAVRSAGGQEAIELQVPDLGTDSGQLVLACDETGVLTWHLPEEAPESAAEAGAARTRGAGGMKRFIIPATPLEPAPPTAAGTRSLLGVVGRKLLKVLVYPATDPVLGAVGKLFAGRWESSNRPYGLRMFEPDTYREPGAPPLDAANWALLSGGRALLFIHGTFSTAHGAFALLPPSAMKTLHERYQGRVFAFNHFTLSHDPRQNVQWLLQQVPSDRPLEVDIVCHSRGGLVARMLAERPAALELPASRVDVKRVVFAGVPNYGTLLAHPDHMVNMIDRLTTALNLFPTGAVTETLEALITAVKVIGHGGLSGLDGLASMRPEGAFLEKLNGAIPKNREYFAIAADYEPAGQGLRALIRGTVVDAALDLVFENAANDLVVPEEGVYGVKGSGTFPIPSARLLKIGAEAGVIHTTLFGHDRSGEKVLEWLS